MIPTKRNLINAAFLGVAISVTAINSLMIYVNSTNIDLNTSHIEHTHRLSFEVQDEFYRFSETIQQAHPELKKEILEGRAAAILGAEKKHPIL